MNVTLPPTTSQTGKPVDGSGSLLPCVTGGGSRAIATFRLVHARTEAAHDPGAAQAPENQRLCNLLTHEPWSRGRTGQKCWGECKVGCIM